MRFLLNILSFLLLSTPLAAGDRILPSVPPPRAAFKASAPPDVHVAKLWWDIGLFHPFTGSVSRDQWEKSYFQLLNKACEAKAEPCGVAAEALALLQDPYSMLLPSKEGRGSHFLPVIWEIREDGPWIIGGASVQVKEPFGPVTGVDGTPLRDFLSLRLGSVQTPERVFAALSYFGRRELAFQVKVSSGSRTITLTSQDAVGATEGYWVEGGWKGAPAIRVMGFRGRGGEGITVLKTLKALDLRMANWGLYSLSKTFGSFLTLRGAQAPQVPMVRLVREHRGQYDADWDRFANDSFSYNRIGAYPTPNRVEWIKDPAPIEATLPPILIDSGMAESLAGWSFPAAQNHAARTTRYEWMPGLDIQLRLESWAADLSSAKSQATYQNFPLLTPAAAKALATATILNFDHYFGFTPEAMQEDLFRRAIEIHQGATCAMDVVLRSGRATRDVHGHTQTMWLGIIRDPLFQSAQDAALSLYGYQGSHPSLPAYAFSRGPIRMLRSLKDGPNAGQSLNTLDHQDFKSLFTAANTWSPYRPECRDALLHGGMNLARAFEIPVQAPPKGKMLSISTGAASEETKTYPVPARELDPGKDLKPFEGPLPKGWRMAENPSFEDLTTALERGERLILDARIYSPTVWPGLAPWILSSKYKTPNQGDFRRTPDGPFSWGSISPIQGLAWGNPAASLSVRGNPAGSQSPLNPVLPGRLLILVNGATASHPEIISMFLKESFPENVFLAGLPTGGTTGALTYLFLPVGDGGNGMLPYSPTISFDVINGKNASFVGLPLDYEVTEQELWDEMERGTSHDPLLSTVLRAIPKIKGLHPSGTGQISRPQTGSKISPIRAKRK